MTIGPELYHRVRTRMLALAATLDADQSEAPVPALPQWTVREAYAHVVGNAADILAGDTARQGAADRTAEQVAERADRSLARICAEWAGDAERFDAVYRQDQSLWKNSFELWQHEQDVRAALGGPVHRDADAIRFSLDLLAPAATALWPDGTPAVRLAADDLDAAWQFGPGAFGQEVHADGYELIRAAAGRRSRRQVEALGWDDPAPHLRGFAAFDFPDHDLIER